MWPPGHLAVAYLLLSWNRWVRGDSAVTAGTMLALGVGSQLPDLFDKPLAWAFALPSGRTFGHSLLFVLPLTVVCFLLARRSDQPELGTAASVGLLSHVAVDAVPALWDPRTSLTFLLWPLVSTTPYDEPFPGLPELVIDSASDPYLLFEIALVVVALLFWHRDGYPGLSR
jgi:membrane-bound metal-dependent hydrolase YbcI (DUF457 family)